MCKEMSIPRIRDYQGQRIHLIGIGGSSMSGLAEMLMDQGYRVSGSDRDEGYLIQGVREKGAEVVGVSKQAVSEGLKRAEKALSHYEEILGLVARWKRENGI